MDPQTPDLHGVEPVSAAPSAAPQRRPRFQPAQARLILVAALLLGIAADTLLRSTPWGLNVTLVTVLFVTAGLLVARQSGIPLTGEGRWMAAPMLGFAAALAWRDSPTLSAANWFGLVTSSVLFVGASRSAQLHTARVIEYVKHLLVTLFASLTSFAPALFVESKLGGILARGNSSALIAIARGLLLAVLPIAVFGALFVAADAQFERLVTNLFRLDPGDLFVRIGFIALYTWILGGLLRELAVERGESSSRSLIRGRLGAIEIGVVLGLVNLLFLSFVLVQFSYFFDGTAQGRQLGFDQYARRGFFELVWVAGLTLPLLLAAHALIKPDRPIAEGLYRGLAALLAILLSVVMLSAMLRMRLLVESTGLSELRIQSSTFMAWIALVLVWFLVTTVRGRSHRFAFGALVSGFLAIATVNVLNPDALIVRYNAQHGHLQASGQYARFTVASYSADAIPAIVETLPGLAPAERASLELQLRARRLSWPQSDWRTYNWSREQARAALNSIPWVLTSSAEPAQAEARASS